MEASGFRRTLVTNHSPDYTVLVSENKQHLKNGRKYNGKSHTSDNFVHMVPDLQFTLSRIWGFIYVFFIQL
jgi:hypothetical protein